MDHTRVDPLRRMFWRLAVGFTLFLGTLLLGVELARAGEIVPAIGISRTLNSDEPSRTYANLAIRGDLLPMLQTEVGVGYRSEQVLANQLDVRMWPVTASLWFKPLSAIYAGGGVGWYHTTLDYASNVPLHDETRENFGVHLGGGLQVPLGGPAAVDLGGRYVMMRPQESPLIPQHFDPDFWTTTLGLAFRF